MGHKKCLIDLFTPNAVITKNSECTKRLDLQHSFCFVFLQILG